MNELTNILAETVERLFRDLMTEGMPQAENQSAFAHMWNAIEELGITNLFLSEENGGFEGEWLDAFSVFKLLGSHALPLPVGETIVAKKLLQDCDMKIPDAAITIGTARKVNIQRNKNSEQWLFSGEVPLLPWGQTVQSALIQCHFDDKNYYALLSTKHASLITRDFNQANEPRDTLRFVNCPVMDLKLLDNNVDNLFSSGAMLRTCQVAGALEAALELSIQYVQERKQFGKSISKFQVIQHQLALLAEHCAATNCAAQSACSASDQGDGNFEIAAAKLRANRAVAESTSIAHQVHGAIGFTQEYRLHYFTQRLWSWRSEFGNDRHWARYLGNQIIQAEPSELWANLTARSDARG